ncbi:MAG: GAF domain-containing protein [Anaerolineae bacterium]|nr:GAF domain-containing protein [Anaerolineae bacterium]
MSDDRLRHSLEKLFSDISLPAPEAEAKPFAPPLPPTEGQPPEPKTKPPSPTGAPAGPPSRGITTPDKREESTDEKKTALQDTTPPPEDMQTWRRQLIRGVFRALTPIGALAVLVGSYFAYTKGDVWVIPFYLGAYAFLTLITFWRRVSYALQAGVLLGLIYGLGLLDLIEVGKGGDGRIFLLAIPFLAALFFGRREGIFALILTALTLVAFGWAFSTGHIVVSVEKQATSADPTAWLSNIVIFLMLATLPMISQNCLATRLTASLTRSRNLAQGLEIHQARLEEQVAERTRELQKANWRLQQRAIQLRASVEIGHAATSILDIDRLLHTTVNLIHDEFRFYHVGVFLIDETGEWAVLQEATGEVGQQMKAQGHRLAVDDHSMVGWTAVHRQSRTDLDIGRDAAHFDNPLLPHTRSEMTLPLLVGGRLLGVLDVQSTGEAAFDEDDVRTLRIMANQVAVAIENARKFSDEALLLEATSPIHRASRRLTTATTTSEVADAIIDSVAETRADGCIVVQFEFSPAGEPEALLYLRAWRRDREPLFQTGMRLPIAESPFPFEMVSTFWVVDDVERDERLPQSARQVFEATDAKALVNIPLRAGGETIGQVVVLRTTPGPFLKSALRLYETLSDQASVALEHARLLEETQQRAEYERHVSEITARVHASTDVDTILQTAIRELGQALQASDGLIQLGASDGASSFQVNIAPSSRPKERSSIAAARPKTRSSTR